jgi:predicted transposase YdaD
MEHDRLEFLDKEVFTDVASAERHEVDLLVKARFRERGDAFFLVHVENQASAQEDFPRRMFRYFARLHEKFALPVFPVALFSYDQPIRPEPDHYRVEFPNQHVLDFSFRTIQLNRQNWRDYVRNPNPIASALMAKMRIAPQDRPRVKLECLRMLVTLKLDKARATMISAFMDSYLKLTAAETQVYNRELDTIEPQDREVVMQWTNEWIERGKLEGRSEGRSEGRRELILQLLSRRLGPVPIELRDRVGQLPDTQIDELAEALLDFRDLEDAQFWLPQRA